MVERASTIILPGGRTEVNRVYLPVAHALLPAEDEGTYVRFFKALCEVAAPCTDVQLDPTENARHFRSCQSGQSCAPPASSRTTRELQ
jgi:hypothetical protein